MTVLAAARHPSALQASPEGTLDELAQRSVRLANAVEAVSRRRDTRLLRTRLVLLILDHTCPLGTPPARAWYVPGAAARIGAAGLRRLWARTWGSPPCLNTVRTHLGKLEQACVLIRAPGDWLPVLRDPEHPERRPRYPDTWHVLESDAAAEWWSGEGRRRLEAEPRVRHNPDRWRLVFRRWREEARVLQRDLPWVGNGENAVTIAGWADQFTQRADTLHEQARHSRAFGASTPDAAGPGPLDDEARRRTALRFARLATEVRGSACFFPAGHLRDAGVQVEGPILSSLARAPARAAGACALLAIALWRGDRIRNRAGWLVRAFKHAPAAELERARRAVARGRPHPEGARPCT